MPTAIKLKAHGASNVGLRRQQNQDAFAVVSDQGIFAVADGIGGAMGGEVASEVAATFVPLKLGKRLAHLRRNAAKAKVEATVRTVLQEVNDALVERARDALHGAETGTTIVMAVAWKGLLLVAHMGDSRAYLWRSGTMRKLTEDHSLAAQLVRWGEITESQAKVNPGKATLLRFLGAAEEVVPDFTWVKLRPGDRFLLCSDGLTNMVGEEEIARAMTQVAPPAQCCRQLIDAANQAGGKDNITAVVIHVGGDAMGTPSQEADSAKEESP